MQPYSYQPLPQQQQPQQQLPPQQQQRYVYYYPGAPTMLGVAPPQYLQFQQQQQQQQPLRQQQPFTTPSTITTTTSSSSSASSAAMYPNLSQQPASSLAVTVPLQPTQQQQHFEFEMLPSVDQLESTDANEQEEEEEQVMTIMGQLDATSAAAAAAAPVVKEQSLPVQSTFSSQQQPMYPPISAQTQFMMMPPPPPPQQSQPQQPQLQQQQQQQQQQPEQPCFTAGCHCHCRHHCHFRRHCRQGCVFKALLFLQLALAILFSVMAPHWIPFSFLMLFVFGLISALIQNVPCLIVFSLGNLAAVWLSTIALFSTVYLGMRGYGGFLPILISCAICFLQWASLAAGIHFTIRVAKRKYSCVQQPQQPQPQQQQHVVVGTVAPSPNNILLPTLPTAQQSV